MEAPSFGADRPLIQYFETWGFFERGTRNYAENVVPLPQKTPPPGVPENHKLIIHYTLCVSFLIGYMEHLVPIPPFLITLKRGEGLQTRISPTPNWGLATLAVIADLLILLNHILLPVARQHYQGLQRAPEQRGFISSRAKLVRPSFRKSGSTTLVTQRDPSSHFLFVLTPPSGLRSIEEPGIERYSIKDN